jgi:3-hydroxyacyl-CoA dehydrogenase
MAAKIQFKRIAVIGAGTMGSGIAAQIANAGLDVLLLDLAAKDENEISGLLSLIPPSCYQKKYQNTSKQAPLKVILRR